jgi:hypothetical protein
LLGHRAVDLEDGAGRIVELVLHRGVIAPICWISSRMLLRAGAGGRLIGHGGHPLDQVPCLEQAAERHQHQRHRAVAADVVLDAAAEPASITSRLTGSRMITASSSMRSVEAASIQ